MKIHYPTKEDAIASLKLQTSTSAINTIFLWIAIILLVPKVWPEFHLITVLILVGSLPVTNLITLFLFKKYESFNLIFFRFLFVDNFILTAILYYSGEMRSPVIYIYMIPVLLASAYLSTKKIVILSIVYSISFIFLSFMEMFHIIPLISTPGLEIPAFLYWCLTSVGIILLIAMAVVLGRTTSGEREKTYQLAESRDYIDSIIKSMIDTLVVTDPEGRIKAVNQAALNLLGYEEKELIGKPAGIIFGEEIFKGKKWEKLLEDGLIKDYEMSYRTKTGEEIPVSFSGSVMYELRTTNYEQRIIGIVCVARDIRELLMLEEERKRAAEVSAAEKARYEALQERADELRKAYDELKSTQEQLVRVEKLSIIGKLASAVGHELKNPLATIKNIVFYLKKYIAIDDKKAQEFLDMLNSETNRANKIASDLLDFSRVKKLNKVSANLHNLIEESIRLVNFRDSIKVIKNFDLTIGEVEVDIDRMKQVCINLISNASDAISEEGVITVSTSLNPTDGRYVDISICDTGCGIDEGTLKHIFEPLFTTKSKGMGLGLGIVKDIVEQHQGKITVESQPGKGSKFSILIPYSREE